MNTNHATFTTLEAAMDPDAGQWLMMDRAYYDARESMREQVRFRVEEGSFLTYRIRIYHMTEEEIMSPPGPDEPTPGTATAQR